MAVIAHWLVGPHGVKPRQVVYDEASVEHWQRAGGTVEGPFVPAADCRGAVAENAKLREILRRVCDVGDLAAVITAEEGLRAIDHPGGQ